MFLYPVKYLGLLAMGRILGPHPKAVQPHKDLVLACLDDKDESIRIRALDLLYGMVSKKTVMEIVRRLMTHMDRAEGTFYRDELLQKIIQICSQNNYQYITNFEWYISVLVELCRMEGSHHGGLISSQLMDVAIRVEAVRGFTVGQMALLLENAHVLLGPAAATSSIAEVLFAAAWICGEFSHLLPNPRATLEAILRGRLSCLAGHIQAVLVHSVVKLFVRIAATAEEEDDCEMMNEITTLLEERLETWSSSGDLEVQERAVFALQLVRFVKEKHENNEKLGGQLVMLVAGELNPVAAKAQKKVPIPEGLDLDSWINSPPSESEAEDEEDLMSNDLFLRSEDRSPISGIGKPDKRESYQPTEEELQKRRAARIQEQANNPYYMKVSSSNRSSTRSSPKASLSNLQVDEIPIEAIELSVPLTIPGMTSLSKYEMVDGSGGSKKHRRKKTKKRSKKKGTPVSSSEDEAPTPLIVNTCAGEMPDGATLSDDNDRDSRAPDDPHRALDIDLDSPLSPNEVLPVHHHREDPHIIKIKNSNGAATAAVGNKSKVKRTKKPKTKEKNKKSDSTGSKKSKSRKENLLGEEYTNDRDISQSVNINKSDLVNGVQKPEITTEADDIEFWLSNNIEANEANTVGKDSDAANHTENQKIDDTKKIFTESKSKSQKKKKKKSKLQSESSSKTYNKKSSKTEKMNLHLTSSQTVDLATPEEYRRVDYEDTNGHGGLDDEERKSVGVSRLLAEDDYLLLVSTVFFRFYYISQFTVETYCYADGRCLFKQPQSIIYHCNQYDEEISEKCRSIRPSVYPFVALTKKMPTPPSL